MKRDFILGSLLTMGILFSGCSDDDNKSTDDTTPLTQQPQMLKYKVTVSNLTYGQPMSPIAVAYHDMGTAIFTVGQKATVGLEKLAEGGDNSEFLSELSKQTFIAEYQSGTKLIKPSQNDTVMIESQEAQCISVAYTCFVTHFSSILFVKRIDMKLNITSQYAIRLMTYIAKDNKVLYNSKEISETLNIPYKSLARIITQLVAQNLVTSSRGREGGIQIERPYNKIKLIEILEAVKEEILDASCILGLGYCNSEEKCALHDQWEEPKASMLKMFQETTLEDMIK